MAKFAIVLSGCGQNDGSETHEVILTLLALSQQGIEWDAFAPNVNQSRVYDHAKEMATNEKRNALTEAARLVRGKIANIEDADIDQYDGVIVPGGWGAVSTLCNYAEKGVDFAINPDIEKFLKSAASKQKVAGYICIAPILIPKLYKSAKLTIGNDAEIAQQINQLGSEHACCVAEDVIVDASHKVVSTPANMVANNIDEVYQGIHKLVIEMKKMM